MSSNGYVYNFISLIL